MTNNERKECISALRQLLAMCDFVDQYGDCIDADPYFDAVETAIESLNETEWIPVSERLPDDKTYVLTTIQVNGRQPHARSGFYHGGFFHNDNGETWRATEKPLKAWMPLPEPYREDREEYELATEQMEHDAMYEPTYNSEDGSM